MPAFGFSAVPLPIKNRKMLPGCQPIADALGDAAEPTKKATGSIGSPLVVLAAAFAILGPDTTSRRDAANAAHANGAAAGAPPSPPAPSHDNRLPLRPDTAPRGDAAVITGTSADTSTGAASTDSTTTFGATADGESPATGVTDGSADTSDDERGEDAASGAGASEDGATTLGATTAPAESVLPPPLTASEPATRLGACTAAEAPRRTLARGDDEEESPSEEVLPPAPEEASESLPEPRGPASPRASPPAASPRDAADREPPRVAVVLGAESDAAEDSEELEPADPVVSANAIGTDATAEPTPNATANTPTRPM